MSGKTTPNRRIEDGSILFQRQADQERNARFHYLETAQAISQAILEASDITNILDELLEKTMAVGGFDLGNIRLLNTTGKIVAAAYCGYRDTEKARCRHSGAEKPEKRLALREVTESGRILIIDDLSSESRMKGFKEEGARSGIGLPVAARGEIYGVLALARRSQRHFQPAEVRLLESIGAQIGMGVQKSRLLEETKRQAEKLKEANKLQADFSAMIAHDLRSPLFTMIGIVDMMKGGCSENLTEEQSNLTEDQKMWLARIKKNATGLVNLVSDFLDVSKLESGQISLSRTDVQIEELVGNAIENFRPLAKGKNIALSWHTAAAIPPVHADPRRLDQVVSNLLSNAVKFTGAGGAIQILIGVNEDAQVRVAIHDTGVGIPRAEIGNLFEKYRQIARVNEPAQTGTGLGLVICKMIVEAHGGKIWAESQEGNGAAFIFTLPLDVCLLSEDDGNLVAPNR